MSNLNSLCNFTMKPEKPPRRTTLFDSRKKKKKKEPVLCLFSPDAMPSHSWQVFPYLTIEAEGIGGVP